MKNSGQGVFLPLFILQLPQKTLARYDLCQEDWIELLAVLLDIDISRSNLTDSLISLDDFCAVLRVALQRFGFASFVEAYVDDIRARHMGAVGLAMEAAPTLEESLNIWRDNAAILAPMLRIEERATADARVYSVQLAADLGDLAEPYLEIVLLMSAALVRNLSGGAVVPGIRFAHAPLQPPAFYRDRLGLEPLFRQGDNGLSVTPADTAVANDYYVPLMYQQALRGIRELQENIHSHLRFGFRVRKFLQQQAEVGSFPSLEATAAHFCMAPRTFTRHLGEDVASFRALRQEVQLALAQRLLRKSRLPVKAIAEKAGFSNVSAFSRAFHLACGQTPQAFRGSETDLA